MSNDTAQLVSPWIAQRRRGTVLQMEKDNRVKERSPSKVNARGRTVDCKVNCWNTTSVPNLLSVQSLSQMGAVIDKSTCAAIFKILTDQSFVQLERETNAHFYLSLVEDMLSQTFLDKGLLQGFQAAAQVLENLDKSERKNVCLAAYSNKNNTMGNDICQHPRPVTTDQLQTRITPPFSNTRQILGSIAAFWDRFRVFASANKRT